MRRTDLSRKMGKIMTVIEEEVASGKKIDIEHICFLVRSETELKNDKQITLEDGTIVVNFKDTEFEGTLKNKNIYEYDSEARALGVKSIKNLCGMIQIKYIVNTSKLELNLIVEAEYIDNTKGKKHKVFPCLKSLETLIKNTKIETEEENNKIVEESVKTTIEDDTKESTENTEIEEENITEEQNYKNNLREFIIELFKDRFFGSEPSRELVSLLIDKIHTIYMVSYLESCFNTNIEEDNKQYCLDTIKKMIETL